MVNTCTIADLQKRPASAIERACDSKEPVLIVQNGRANALIIDADTYLANMQALNEFKRIFTEGVKGVPTEVTLNAVREAMKQ